MMGFTRYNDRGHNAYMVGLLFLIGEPNDADILNMKCSRESDVLQRVHFQFEFIYPHHDCSSLWSIWD